MNRIMAGLLCICCILSGFTACAVKSSGRAGSTEEVRIVCTSVAVCDVLDKLDLELVGVPQTSFELPERYKDVQKVGLPMNPDMEIVKSLNPTDIISPNSLQYDLKPRYDNIGAASTFVNLMSVEGLFHSIGQLGEKYDRVEQAEALVEDYQAFMQEYNSRIKGKKRPEILLLMGLPGAYMVATEKSYVGNLVKLAGGRNVFGDEDGALLNVNTEAISRTKPDFILLSSHGMPEEAKKMFEKEFRENDIWKHFSAVQEGNVYNLPYETFNMSASLGYKDALNKLQEILYGQD